MGELYAPEISPDGQLIVFTNAGATYSSIWVMDRDGRNPREIYSVIGEDALDPTWSPDGEKILFAQGQGNNKKLYIVNKDGSGLKILNDSFTTRGRSDWSENGRLIAGYTGGSWEREIFIMNSDGSNLKELFSSGNAQAPSFSPNDKWITFTGYIDNIGNEDGCEIYIIGMDGIGLQRLTENEFCDWQPRWGP
jgi:TolB protein